MAKVLSVRYCKKADVYNMEVEDTHDFVTKDGVVLHNCYDETRYFLMERPISAQPIMELERKPYNPLT